jgi:hypothetical protein
VRLLLRYGADPDMTTDSLPADRSGQLPSLPFQRFFRTGVCHLSRLSGPRAHSWTCSTTSPAPGGNSSCGSTAHLFGGPAIRQAGMFYRVKPAARNPRSLILTSSSAAARRSTLILVASLGVRSSHRDEFSLKQRCPRQTVPAIAAGGVASESDAAYGKSIAGAIVRSRGRPSTASRSPPRGSHPHR